MAGRQRRANSLLQASWMDGREDGLYGDDATRAPHAHKPPPWTKEVGMKKIVDLLFAKVLTDVELSFFFAGVDMEHLKCKQEQMMELLFSGQHQVDDASGMLADLREAHVDLIREKGLTEHHFELFVKHFDAALKELPSIPAEKKASALENMRLTRQYFKPLQPGE